MNVNMSGRLAANSHVTANWAWNVCFEEKKKIYKKNLWIWLQLCRWNMILNTHIFIIFILHKNKTETPIFMKQSWRTNLESRKLIFVIGQGNPPLYILPLNMHNCKSTCVYLRNVPLNMFRTKISQWVFPCLCLAVCFAGGGRSGELSYGFLTYGWHHSIWKRL